jgi:LmbE family N-acetylglucosaminyl deacetylase
MAQLRLYQQIANLDNCAIIVAHPDDETLWAGGTMLMHPEVKWKVVTLCRKNDQDRAARFSRALEHFNATGAMGDLDDGPEQLPLSDRQVQDTIRSLLPPKKFDLIITHGIWGEYTRHKRHEETGKAVLAMRKMEELSARQLWTFAYEDGGGEYLPRPVGDPDLRIRLPKEIWLKKYEIVTEVYGFSSESFEANTTPREEAFWCFGAGDNVRRKE